MEYTTQLDNTERKREVSTITGIVRVRLLMSSTATVVRVEYEKNFAFWLAKCANGCCDSYLKGILEFINGAEVSSRWTLTSVALCIQHCAVLSIPVCIVATSGNAGAVSELHLRIICQHIYGLSFVLKPGTPYGFIVENSRTGFLDNPNSL